MANHGKRMVKENLISQIGQGGSGTTVSGTNDGTNWTSLTIDDDTYGIPQGGGQGAKTYGLTIEELNTKYGKGADMQRYSLSEIVAAGLPILGTIIASQSQYTDQLITVNKGDANEIILKDLFGVVRFEDNQYVVHVCRTNTTGTNAANEFYAYRIGDNDWIIKGARWANERNLAPEYEYQYSVIDLTNMNSFFDELQGTGDFYYYDTTQETYVYVDYGDTYDPDKTYYLFDGSSYAEQPITPEAYFNFLVGYHGYTLYIKVGDNYVEAVEYDASQTYYTKEEVVVGQGKAEMFTSTAGSNIGVSSDSAKSLVHIEQVNIQLDNPVMNVRYDNQVKVPTSEGSYVLGVAVNSSGNPTFSWATPTTGTSIYAHTANFVLEDGSSGDSYTVTMQFNYGTQTGLDAVAFEGLFDSVTGEFAYPYTAYFRDGGSSAPYLCRLTFGGTLFVIEPFANPDHSGNIIDLELEELGFSDVGIGY